MKNWGLWRCRIKKDFFLKKEAKTFALFCAVGVAMCAPAAAEDEGRDFPKTLIFDEPGIDDEVSLPTVIVAPQSGGNETDVDFELDKRLTTWMSLQVNIGYTQVPRPAEQHGEGWQNATATLKFVAFSNRENEQLVSLSLIRAFGGSGARQVGAAPVGNTAGAVNFGQGFAAFMPDVLKPLALTGSTGFLIPDRERPEDFQQALLSASLQYSFEVLSTTQGGDRLPKILRPFIPIIECSFTLPTKGGGQSGVLAPGLIYAGDGYQLAAEALMPLTKKAGTHTGFIAQLNISLESVGLHALAHPLF